MAGISGIFLACLAAIFIAQQYLGIEKEIAAALYTGFITIFGSVLAIVIGKQIETKAAHERQLRDKKLPIYQNLINHVLEFMPEQGDEESQDISQKEINRRKGIKTLREMSRSLITWGSDDALKKWINYIVKLRGENKDIKESSFDTTHPDILERFLDPRAETILAIRKELGHKNKGISKDDILVIDIPYIKELRKSRQTKRVHQD